MTGYIARGGKVFDDSGEEAGTARTARGRDLERHDAALAVARAQREAIAASWLAHPEKEQHPHPSRVAVGGALGIADRCAWCPMIRDHDGGHLHAADVDAPWSA